MSILKKINYIRSITQNSKIKYIIINELNNDINLSDLDKLYGTVYNSIDSFLKSDIKQVDLVICYSAYNKISKTKKTELLNKIFNNSTYQFIINSKNLELDSDEIKSIIKKPYKTIINENITDNKTVMLYFYN